MTWGMKHAGANPARDIAAMGRCNAGLQMNSLPQWPVSQKFRRTFLPFR